MYLRMESHSQHTPGGSRGVGCCSPAVLLNCPPPPPPPPPLRRALRCCCCSTSSHCSHSACACRAAAWACAPSCRSASLAPAASWGRAGCCWGRGQGAGAAVGGEVAVVGRGAGSAGAVGRGGGWGRSPHSLPCGPGGAAGGLRRGERGAGRYEGRVRLDQRVAGGPDQRVVGGRRCAWR